MSDDTPVETPVVDEVAAPTEEAKEETPAAEDTPAVDVPGVVEDKPEEVAPKAEETKVEIPAVEETKQEVATKPKEKKQGGDDDVFDMKRPAFFIPFGFELLGFVFTIIGLLGNSIYGIELGEGMTLVYGFGGYCSKGGSEDVCMDWCTDTDNCDGAYEFSSCTLGSARVFCILALVFFILTPITWMHRYRLLPQAISNQILKLPASVSEHKGIWGSMDLMTAFMIFMSLVTVDPNYNGTLDDYTVNRGASYAFLIVGFFCVLISGALQIQHYHLNKEESPAPVDKPRVAALYKRKVFLIPFFCDILAIALIALGLFGGSIYTIENEYYTAGVGFASMCVTVVGGEEDCNAYDNENYVFPTCNLGWAMFFCVMAFALSCIMLPSAIIYGSDASLAEFSCFNYLFNKLPAMINQNDKLWAYSNLYIAFFLLLSILTVFPGRETAVAEGDTIGRGLDTIFLILALLFTLGAGAFGFTKSGDITALPSSVQAQTPAEAAANKA